jgi:hypothetical protein
MNYKQQRMWCALQGPRYWRRNNNQSGYSFTRKGPLTKAFIDAIIKGPITRKEFLISQGHNARPGLLTSFFAGIRQAGIVKLDTTTWEYSLGPNYNHWQVGLLNKI